MIDAGRLTAKLRQLGHRMRHPSDEDLLALIESATSDAHVDGCERCSTRHAELLCLIAEIDVIHSEADAVFDEERLLHQRTHILRRLDRNNGPARVLRFPAGAEGERSMRVMSSVARRWVAAAAIGGVLVGIFSGRLLTRRTDGDPAEAMRQARAISATRGAASPGIVTADLRGASPGLYDELLLDEVDSALSQRRVHELVAIDAITPAAR
jgi:hypothetical protein